MPFSLTNPTASFQNMTQEIFRDLIDHGVVVYMDNIIVYTKTQAEYIILVVEVLRRLQQWNLAASLETCDWHRSSVQFSGYIILNEGVGMSDGKVQSVLE